MLLHLPMPFSIENINFNFHSGGRIHGYVPHNRRFRAHAHDARKLYPDRNSGFLPKMPPPGHPRLRMLRDKAGFQPLPEHFSLRRRSLRR